MLNLPSKARCEEILAGPNHDIDSWVCPLCAQESTRAHWVADHVLAHLRNQDPEPPEKYKRPIEME